jgi:hypothetical protein
LFGQHGKSFPPVWYVAAIPSFSTVLRTSEICFMILMQATSM